MTLQEALTVLAEVCARFVGNLDDHQKIQAALGVVQAACEPAAEIPAHTNGHSELVD